MKKDRKKRWYRLNYSTFIVLMRVYSYPKPDQNPSIDESVVLAIESFIDKEQRHVRRLVYTSYKLQKSFVVRCEFISGLTLKAPLYPNAKAWMAKVITQALWRESYETV